MRMGAGSVAVWTRTSCEASGTAASGGRSRRSSAVTWTRFTFYLSRTPATSIGSSTLSFATTTRPKTSRRRCSPSFLVRSCATRSAPFPSRLGSPASPKTQRSITSAAGAKHRWRRSGSRSPRTTTSDASEEGLLSALSQLPEDQRNVLALRHIVGLAPNEIARRLEKSEPAIHGLHHRGRTAIRQKLSELDAALRVFPQL